MTVEAVTDTAEQNNEFMNEEWMSVSSYARKVGKSTTFIYSLIKEKKIEFKSFNRGKYVGYLIKYCNE